MFKFQFTSFIFRLTGEFGPDSAWTEVLPRNSFSSTFDYVSEANLEVAKESKQAGSSTSQAPVSDVGTSTSSRPQVHLVKVQKHIGEPVALIKLNEESAAKRIFQLQDSYINGIQVVEKEILTTDPSAFLIKWNGSRDTLDDTVLTAHFNKLIQQIRPEGKSQDSCLGTCRLTYVENSWNLECYMQTSPRMTYGKIVGVGITSTRICQLWEPRASTCSQRCLLASIMVTWKTCAHWQTKTFQKISIQTMVYLIGEFLQCSQNIWYWFLI